MAGGVILVWLDGDAQRQVTAARRTSSGTWTTPVPLSVAGSQTWNPGVAADPHGDAVAVWQRAVEGDAQYEAVGLDGSSPVLGTPVIPATAYAGKPVAFAASPTDAWSAVSTTWSFGDGVSSAGTNVTHAFATGGTYTVTVTATDAVGNGTSTTGQVAVIGKPVLSEVKVTKRKIHARAQTPGRTRLKLTLSTAAQVRVRLVTDKKGAGKRRVVATLTRSLGAGAGSIVIRGKVGGKQLKPGRFELRVLAVNPAGRSNRVERRLVVVAP